MSFSLVAKDAQGLVDSLHRVAAGGGNSLSLEGARRLWTESERVCLCVGTVQSASRSVETIVGRDVTAEQVRAVKLRRSYFTLTH